ncbi:hypothetical protein ACS0TY_014047 [Phlomoides rotata]
MIDVKDEGVWDIIRTTDIKLSVFSAFYLIVHFLVKGSRYKTWPYYSSWIKIFGKDRATGENAMDPIDLANDLLCSAGQEQGGDNKENYIPVNPIEKPLPKGLKRKNIDTEVNSLVDTLGVFMKQSQETFGDIAKGLGTSNEKRIDNKHLNEIMNHIVGLKIADKLKILPSYHDGMPVVGFPNPVSSSLLSEQESDEALGNRFGPYEPIKVV